MKREEALRELQASFARPCATPDHGALDREAFLETEREKLRQVLIEPIPVKAVTTDWGRAHATLRDDRYDMFAIAGEGREWLLLNPETREFSLAYGDPSTGVLELLGFASDDALAEWRG